MIQKAWEFDSLDSSKSLMLRVLEDVAARRCNGDNFPDEAVIAAHPQLMPELREMLSAMSLTETARKRASEPATQLENDQTSHPADKQRHHDETRPGRLEREPFRGYELGEVIGRGATGVVYRATQTSTGREVAIKVLIQGTFESNSEEARFERSCTSSLAQHPNIVTIYDTGWSSGRFFLVMDYVRGQQLDQWLREASPRLEEKLQMFASIAETVHAAHLRGVIHRDLKPSNIRIDESGSPHLLDFGLAKILDATGNGRTDDVPPAYTHSMTMTGQFVGSLPWASPEQAEGAPHKIDIRTDVYSLGVIFYHALAGRFPYSVMGNIRDVIDRILMAAPPRLRSTHPELDEDVETIVLTCLNKERDRRYQSAGELAQDL
jgi:serine/threonine protein kinase